MRFLMIAVAAMVLSLPAAAPASACGAGAHAAKVTTTYSADETKPPKKKILKRTVKRKTIEKVEYMRAVPTEPPKK